MPEDDDEKIIVRLPLLIFILSQQAFSMNANNCILFMGNIGSGKSTILNSIINKSVFLSGESFSRITECYQTHQHDGVIFIDTPGFCMTGTSQEEIENALKMKAFYKIFFILSSTSGRIRREDINAINQVMSLINNEDKSFNIIINKINKKEKALLFNDNNGFNRFCSYLNSGEHKASNVTYIEFDEAVEHDTLIHVSKRLSKFIHATSKSFYLNPEQVYDKQHRPINLTEKERLKKCSSEIFHFIKETQIKHGPDLGAWPSHITGRKLKIDKIIDNNFFIALQTSLSLSQTSKRLPLPDLSQINDRIIQLAERYINNSSLAKRPPGSVCFWPYLEISSGYHIHNLSSKEETLNLFNNINLPNDLDTSSRLALFLLNNETDHEFIKKFLDISNLNLNKEHGAFFTWINDGINNNIDHVVNLNTLAAISRYRKLEPLSHHSDESNFSVCNFINKTIENNTFFETLEYYDRPSEAFLSYSMAVHEGTTHLLESLPSMRKSLLKYARRAYLNKTTSPTELAELIISVYHLALAVNDYHNNQTILHGLCRKLLNSVWDNELGYIKNHQSVYIGRFPKDIFDWSSEAYSAALIIEALSIFIHR